MSSTRGFRPTGYRASGNDVDPRLPPSRPAWFDTGDVRQRLARLRRVADVKTKDLQGQDKEDLNELVTLTHALHDKPEYPILSQEARTAFSGYTPTEPGTVGAYFVGAFTNVNLPRGVPPLCSPLHANAMPPPRLDSPDGIYCDYSIYIASFENGRYVITHYNQGSLADRAIIYVRAANIGGFHGFNQHEFEALKNHGIQYAYLVGMSAGSRDYVPLTDGFIPLRRLPSRVEMVPTPGATVPPGGQPTAPVVSGSGGVWTALLVATVAIILAVILLRASARRTPAV